MGGVEGRSEEFSLSGSREQGGSVENVNRYIASPRVVIEWSCWYE